jgi:dGTP triphosphohydrolase
MKLLPIAVVLSALAACSDVGPGLKNHPGDCAFGFAWADCLPGTAGYKPTQAQLEYQGVFKRQAAVANQNKQRMEMASAEAQDCIARRKADGLTHTASAECINDVYQRAFSDIHYVYMDLFDGVSATRLRTAEQIDKGEITEAEGAVRIADKVSAMVTEERRRNVESNNANAATTSANAAVSQAEAARQQNSIELMRQLTPPPRPIVVQPSMPTQTNCNTNNYASGSQTNCTTY